LHRFVERIEIRYPKFPGLNLTFEALEGQAHRVPKEQWAAETKLPSLPPGRGAGPEVRGEELPVQPVPHTSPLLEVQVVDAADSIAYTTHDADDALELGLLSIDELIEQPLWREAAVRVHRRSAALAGDDLRRAVLHELIEWQVTDLVRRMQHALAAGNVASVDDVCLVGPMAIPSPEIRELKRAFEGFLFQRVYRHPSVLATRRRSTAELEAMFLAIVSGKERLPEKFAALAAEEDLPRATADYLAGMTDRFALSEAARLAIG
jgi:dGTPase